MTNLKILKSKIMTHSVALIWYMLWPIFIFVAFQAVKFFVKKQKFL